MNTDRVEASEADARPLCDCKPQPLEPVRLSDDEVHALVRIAARGDGSIPRAV